MMVQSGKYSHYQNSDLELIDLPYASGKYNMMIILPKLPQKIDDIISGFSYSNWKSWIRGVNSDSGNIFIPKFSLSYEIKLNDILSALGMPTAFTLSADFTKINKSGGLLIDKVKHKTFIEVNEEGTEAAAVTVVEIIKTSMPDIFTFYVNKPFVFIIHENYSNSIIFVGKVVDI
jgi:serpin B